MLVELLRAKRKSADRDDDDSENAHPGIKRTRLDDRDHVPLPLPLYHRVSGAPICYLATTASATVEDPYDWTCEVCREQVASDDPAPRQHCAAHSVDVCERCHAVRAAAGELEVEPMLDDEHEEEEEDQPITDDDCDDEPTGGAQAFLEQEADEATEDEADDEEMGDAEDDTQSDDETDDDSASSGDEAAADDLTDVRRTEDETDQAETLAAAEVQRLLRQALDHDHDEKHVPVATATTLARLQQLWSAHPGSRRVALDLCTNELHADGYGRVRIEADRALLATLVAHLTTAEVPRLLRAMKHLYAAGHLELLSVLCARVCILSPESAPALVHNQWHAMSSRDRRKVGEALVHAVGDVTMTAEAFRAGPLHKYRQTFPELHFSVTYVQDELLHRVADCDGAAALSALEKLGHVWSAFPLSGVTVALRAIARWSSLTDAAEWQRYGEAIRRMIAQHVTVQHLDALVQTCHAALQEPIVYPLMGPLYARLTEVAPPAVVASLARMHTEAQVDVEALDVAADEADAREMAAEPVEEPDEDDEEFVATDDDEDDGHELSDIVRCFAMEHIEETGDIACRVPANVIYQRFVAQFRTVYPEEENVPSQKAFGNEFQRLFPNKVRTRVVQYLGIMLR
ncbi:MAG: hypothetical protein WBJ21_05995 [Burkholderiaceae bacterium]